MTLPDVVEIFRAYRLHPEFLGGELADVNQRGAMDSTLLHIAARTGAISHIYALVAAGANIDARGDMGATPLHDAALCGQLDAVKALVKLGANASLLNEFAQTPLDVAIAGGKGEVANTLRES